MKTASDLLLGACCGVAALLRILVAIQAGLLLTSIQPMTPAIVETVRPPLALCP